MAIKKGAYCWVAQVTYNILATNRKYRHFLFTFQLWSECGGVGRQGVGVGMGCQRLCISEEFMNYNKILLLQAILSFSFSKVGGTYMTPAIRIRV
jgi:hypothetical protein